MKILLVKLGAWKYWKEKALHVSIIYEVNQMPVSQHYLMMEDGGGST